MSSPGSQINPLSGRWKETAVSVFSPLVTGFMLITIRHPLQVIRVLHDIDSDQREEKN
jgi:hypothetical protein